MSTHMSPSAQLVLDNVFDDMDSFASATGGWEFDFRQLDPGRLRARASIIAGQPGAALRASFNRRLHQRGCAPPGVLAFGLPDRPLSWCGAHATIGDVTNFNLKNGFDGVSEAGFTGTVLLLDQREVERRAAELGLDIDIQALVSARALWSAPRAGVNHLRRRLSEMFRTIRTPEGQVEANGLLGGAVMTELLGIIAHLQGGREGSDPTTRGRALRAALDLLEDSARLPVSVADLCQAARVSRPTMYRAFQEEIGVSPKSYIQARSLSGARRELLAAAPDALVADIANRWGFWHLGQFAADYRRHFGELPSDTLAHR
jgi:AraC family ethanolamine operon transcriptional activator